MLRRWIRRVIRCRALTDLQVSASLWLKGSARCTVLAHEPRLPQRHLHSMSHPQLSLNTESRARPHNSFTIKHLDCVYLLLLNKYRGAAEREQVEALLVTYHCRRVIYYKSLSTLSFSSWMTELCSSCSTSISFTTWLLFQHQRTTIHSAFCLKVHLTFSCMNFTRFI